MIGRILKNKKIHQFVRFVFVGVIATVIHYVIYYFLQVAGIQYNISYTLGYIISFIFNFFASNYYTFKTNPNLKRILGFATAHVINYLLQMGLLNLYIHFGIDKRLAPVFVYCITIPTNFILVKFALKNNKFVKASEIK